MDPWCSPEIVTGHLTDEGTELRINLGSSAPGSPALPTPVEPEASSMPPNHGVGLDRGRNLNDLPADEVLAINRDLAVGGLFLLNMLPLWPGCAAVSITGEGPGGF